MCIKMVKREWPSYIVILLLYSYSSLFSFLKKAKLFHPTASFCVSGCCSDGIFVHEKRGWCKWPECKGMLKVKWHKCDATCLTHTSSCCQTFHTEYNNTDWTFQMNRNSHSNTITVAHEEMFKNTNYYIFWLNTCG